MGLRVTGDRRARRRGAGPERQVWRKEKEETVWRKKDKSERAARRGGRVGTHAAEQGAGAQAGPHGGGAGAGAGRGARRSGAGPRIPSGSGLPGLAPP